MLHLWTTDLCARACCLSCRAPGPVLCEECRMGLGAPVSDGEPLPGVDRVLCSWRYQGAARDLVLALKLRAQLAAAGPLADAVVASVRRAGSDADVVTWVPARARDRRARGFDHAEALAGHVARSIGLPVVGLLRRIDARPDQAGLSAVQRRTNLRGAFASHPFVGVILLVDDLVTTGATASACARALKGAGALRVEVAAPCRA